MTVPYVELMTGVEDKLFNTKPLTKLLSKKLIVKFALPQANNFSLMRLTTPLLILKNILFKNKLLFKSLRVITKLNKLCFLL